MPKLQSRSRAAEGKLKEIQNRDSIDECALFGMSRHTQFELVNFAAANWIHYQFLFSIFEFNLAYCLFCLTGFLSVHRWHHIFERETSRSCVCGWSTCAVHRPKTMLINCTLNEDENKFISLNCSRSLLGRRRGTRSRYWRDMNSNTSSEWKWFTRWHHDRIRASCEVIIVLFSVHKSFKTIINSQMGFFSSSSDSVSRKTMHSTAWSTQTEAHRP